MKKQLLIIVPHHFVHFCADLNFQKRFFEIIFWIVFRSELKIDNF